MHGGVNIVAGWIVYFGVLIAIVCVIGYVVKLLRDIAVDIHSMRLKADGTPDREYQHQ